MLTYLRPHLAIGKTVLRLGNLLHSLTLDQRRKVIGYVNRRMDYVLSMPTNTPQRRQYQVMAAYDVWTSLLERIEAYAIYNQWSSKRDNRSSPLKPWMQEAP